MYGSHTVGKCSANLKTDQVCTLAMSLTIVKLGTKKEKVHEAQGTMPGTMGNMIHMFPLPTYLEGSSAPTSYAFACTT